MIGIGTPISHSKIERIALSFPLLIGRVNAPGVGSFGLAGGPTVSPEHPSERGDRSFA